MWILCSFRLIIEEKTDKEIAKSSWLNFLEKFSALLLYQMYNVTPQGNYLQDPQQLYLENTVSNSQKVTAAKIIFIA